MICTKERKMWLKILIILSIINLLAIIWWNASTGNIAYFDGTNTIQIPNPFFTKGKVDTLSIAILFPKDGARDGIILFMGDSNLFKIVYVQDGKIIINTNNDPDQSLILTSDLDIHGKNRQWMRFGFTINDEFKHGQIYFGGAPEDQIPDNHLMIEGSIVPFPKDGLMACTNHCYLNDTNISDTFQKQGLRTYCV